MCAASAVRTLAACPRRGAGGSTRSSIVSTKSATRGPTGRRCWRLLRDDMGFDWFAWVGTDPATAVGVDPLASVPDLHELPRIVRLRYQTPVNRWTSFEGVAALGERANESLVWREALRDHGVADVASVVFRDPFGTWGFLELWSARVYDADDLAMLADLAPRLTDVQRRRRPCSSKKRRPSLRRCREPRYSSSTTTSRWWVRRQPPMRSSRCCCRGRRVRAGAGLCLQRRRPAPGPGGRGRRPRGHGAGASRGRRMADPARLDGWRQGT